MSHDFRLYAHRGASAELPENTLPAFARALEIGVDALELDAHLTRDGHPIVAHDPTAQRMGGVAAAWRDLDLAEAQRIDVGTGFTGPDGARRLSARFCAPSLEQVLVEFPDVRLNVDLKQSWPRMVRQTLRVIRRLKAEDRVTLASFATPTQIAVRQRGYGGETALARAEVMALVALPRWVFTHLPFVGDAAQVPVRAGGVTLARAEFIAKCHDLGMRVDFWTINDPVEARRLIALGADGIMTDDPARLAPALRDVPRAPRRS